MGEGHTAGGLGKITPRRVLWVVGLVFVLDLLVSLGGVGISLAQIRSSLGSLDVSLDGHIALGELREQQTRARRARWFASHPSYALASMVVPDLRHAEDLSAAAADIAGDATHLLSLLSNEGDGFLYESGSVDLRRLHTASGAAKALHSRLTLWARHFESTDALWLDRLERVSSRVGARLGKAASDVEGASRLLERLPSILGDVDPRSYLLVFQSPSEARGGGGLIGVVAELRADRGELSLGKITTVRDLVKRMQGSVDAPAWFKTTYGPLLATREWRTANVSPNFPVTSRVLLRMYQRSTGKSLDGVVATDPLAISALTEVTGPLRADGWEVSINPDNARRVLLHDVYRHFHFLEHLQNRYFANLIDVIWHALSSGDAEIAQLARSLSESVRKQHLKLFFVRREEQETIERLGGNGWFQDDDGVQLVFNNNWSANKIDFFLHRRIETDVELKADGSAQVTSVVHLANEIEGVARNVISRPGVQRGLPLGLNRTLLSVLMPKRATDVRTFLEGRLIETELGLDGGHPVSSVFVDISPGHTEVVTFEYEWVNAVDEGRFDMMLFPQSAVRPDRVTLTVSSEGDRLLQRSVQLKEPLRISVPWSPE